MDWSILHALNGFLVHHDAVEDPSADYVRFSELLFLGLLAWIFVASRGYARRAARRGAVAAGLSAGVALLLASQLANLVGRPRPFVDGPGGGGGAPRRAPPPPPAGPSPPVGGGAGPGPPPRPPPRRPRFPAGSRPRRVRDRRGVPGAHPPLGPAGAGDGGRARRRPRR